MHTSGHQYILFYFSFQTMVNKKHSKQNRKKCGISLRTIKDSRFEIIDGVKYVYCIKHASEGTSRVCGRSLTLASMCFLQLVIIVTKPAVKRRARLCAGNQGQNNMNIYESKSILVLLNLYFN